MIHRDLIVTWPKSRALESYLSELRKAEAGDLQINYRVASRPALPELEWDGRRARVYMVYDGFVRGYNELLAIAYRGPGEVSRVRSDAWAGFWPEGHYLVRDPHWYPVAPVDMQGFRGFRYWPQSLPLPEVIR